VLLSASRTIAAPPGALFAFLADGRNHHKLTGRHIQLLELYEHRESGLRGAMIIRGPLGIRRRAHTRIESSRKPAFIAGIARIGSRTTARVRWDLYEDGRGSTRVALRATVRRAGALDRFLLRVGGAAWMRHLFAATLELLATHTADLVDTSVWTPVLGNDPREPRRASA
jgi:hypothetical protein